MIQCFVVGEFLVVYYKKYCNNDYTKSQSVDSLATIQRFNVSYLHLRAILYG